MAQFQSPSLQTQWPCSHLALKSILIHQYSPKNNFSDLLKCKNEPIWRKALKIFFLKTVACSDQNKIKDVLLCSTLIWCSFVWMKMYCSWSFSVAQDGLLFTLPIGSQICPQCILGTFPAVFKAVHSWLNQSGRILKPGGNRTTGNIPRDRQYPTWAAKGSCESPGNSKC